MAIVLELTNGPLLGSGFNTAPFANRGQRRDGQPVRLLEFRCALTVIKWPKRHPAVTLDRAKCREALLHNRGNCRSRFRPLEANEHVPGPFACLERHGPGFGQIRCVVARRQRVAVQGIDPLPHFSVEGALRVLEVNRGRRRTRVESNGPRIEKRAGLRSDLEAIALKGEPISYDVVGLYPQVPMMQQACRRPVDEVATIDDSSKRSVS
jgi:hypothetical protein